MRDVVVHADDLGFSQASNEGIRVAADEGVLTSASLLATGPAFEHAVTDVLPGLPDLGVGIHLNATDGDGLDATFPGLLARSRDRRVMAGLEREFRGQIERVLEHVPGADHVNSHEHVHAIPALFDLVCRLAAEYGIPYVRDPRESFRAARAPGPVAWYALNQAKVGILRVLGRSRRRIAAAHGVRLNDAFVGVAYTGHMTLAAIRRGLGSTDEGASVVELLLHPTRVVTDRPDEFPSARGRDAALAPGRRAELAALVDPALGELLAGAEWRPTCYACLSGRAAHEHRSRPRPKQARAEAAPPLRAFLVIDDDPFHHPRYVRRLVEDCPDLEVVGAAVVRPAGGTGPERYMRGRLRSLRLGELARLGITRARIELRGRLDPRAERASVAAALRSLGVPHRIVGAVNEEEFLDHVRGFSPDVIVSSNSLIFREPLLELPRVACINRHSALLPAYGGVMPVFRAVQKGERFTGVTVHEMAPEVDRGKVLARIWLPIYPGDTLARLYDHCFELSFDATAEAARRLRADPDPPGLDATLEPSYYSWPEDADWEEFRRRGGRIA